MSTGYLIVKLSTADDAIPIGGAQVIVKDKSGKILHRLVTDENGNTEKVALECPSKNNNLDPMDPGPHCAYYDVVVPAFNHEQQVTVHGIHIMDDETLFLPVRMVPQIEGVNPAQNQSNYYIPPEYGLDHRRMSNPANVPPEETASNTVSFTNPDNPSSSFNGFPAETTYSTIPLANEVPVPQHITVHLGAPSATARNVRVNFKEYIKNVASHEIYATWDRAALYANIYCQIGFALNRIYTVWYRSRGYDYDITNNTGFDQYYVDGGGYYQNISEIVDEIFNMFLRLPGRRAPFFSQYCNGTTATCNGLSQWGSQALAQRGYTPIQILRYYYPSEIGIVQSNNFIDAAYGIFPGTTLKQGSTGEDVRLMQTYLNRISGNYYIPNVGRPDGVFGASTAATVRAFQKVWSHPQDGLIGKKTWYEIIRVYTAVTKLAELVSEGQYISVGTTPPTTLLRLNSRGADVVQLQFLLNFISQYFPYSPYVVEDGVYRQTTADAVSAFQRENGLTADGAVGPMTWQKLYDVYWSIMNSETVPPTTPETPEPPGTPPPFPGTLLRVGSRGTDVALMQRYLNSIARYYPSIGTGTADGIFGTLTESRVKAFQRLFGLTVDGIIGQNTWNRIVSVYNSLPATAPPAFPGAALRQGSSGTDVRVIQNYLNSIANHYPSLPKLTLDGVFGSGTTAAVRAFQQLFGLTVDGVVGEQTWNMIMSIYTRISNP